VATLTGTGLIVRTVDEIIAEIDADLRTDIDQILNLSSTSALGIVRAIFAAEIKSLEDLALAVFNGFTPDGTSGVAQTQLALLTGTERRAATKTTVTATVNLDDGFLAAAGEMIAHVDGDPSRRFVNVEEVENDTGITDDFDIEMEAETAGAVECLAATLTEIAEPLTGWNSITNALDGETGEENETDEELRLRRESELTAQGSTTADAIRADILTQLPDNVTHCLVLVNDSDEVDGNGLPPHSIEAIARGLGITDDDADALAAVILDSKAAGIEAYGSTVRSVDDDQGNTHSIGLTWVDEREVYVDIEVEINAATFPADGDDQIKAAIVALEDRADYQPGLDVIVHRIRAAVFAVDGVEDVPTVEIGFSAAPSGTANLTITVREIAVYDSSRITVGHV
jgi:uncharacterized phage protein gp47/JayE